MTLSVGGGWISSTQFGQSGEGVYGQYYNNANLSGTPAFVRWDNRIDFSWTDGNASPGGSTDPAFRSVGPSNWSAVWNGVLVANFSQTYTFSITSASKGVRLWVTPVGQQQGNPIINDWTSHDQVTDTGTITLTADQEYAVQVQLLETTATVQQIQLQWSSPSTPIEDIEPTTLTGLNVLGGDALFANMVNGADRPYWWAAGSWSTIPLDSNYWPESDAKTLLGEGDTTTEVGGSYVVQFTGMATVDNWTHNVDWVVNGVDLHSAELPEGAGYNPASNTTTATMIVPPSTEAGFYMIFNDTCRDPNPVTVGAISESGTTVTVSLPSVAGFTASQRVMLSGLTGSAAHYDGVFTITGVNSSNNTLTYTDSSSGLPATTNVGTAIDLPANGITNLYLMQPSTLGGNTPLPVGTLFTPAALKLAASYSVLRTMDLSGTNGNQDSNWSAHDLPSDNLWSALDGAPWEVQVALANETGKDLYINVPSNASISYITDLADLFAYGSNGVTPYTSVQQDPVWKPLDPNLKVYIEFSNEIWNSSFTQSESRSDGWANQLSQRALYDFLTNNQNDPLYPGGGNNAYQDGAILASYYNVTSSNDSAFLATYNPSAQAAGDGGSPLYFNNSASLNGYSVGQVWVGLRDVQISTAFKTAFGEENINAVAASSRVRPVFEWQSGGGWDGALAFISNAYNAQHPVSYYLYGGGGAWYSSNQNGGFSDVSFVNPDFASGLNGWLSSGVAGVAANGSSLSNPNGPPLFSAIAISNGATESGNTVTITTTTQQYFAVGQFVATSGVTVNGYNGTYTITAATPTSFTYQDTNPGLASSGDGIVTGTSSSTQTAYLQPGASLSQSVTFSGGYADITLYATQNVAADGADGLRITLTPTNGGPAINNGQPIQESEGAPAFSGVPNAFVWGRTAAFYTGSSAFTYTVTFSNTLPSGSVFFDNVAIQTVNGMFNETDAAMKSGVGSISSAVESDVKIAKQYGLYEVGYEGGYFFGQNLSGNNDLNGYKDMGIQGYSSSVPNVGMYANLDPRTVPRAVAILDQFYAAGGTLAIEYESAYNINSWAVAAPNYYNWDTPKVQATASVEQETEPATYGLTIGRPGTSVYWWLNAAQGNEVENTYLLPYGIYQATMTFGGGWGDTPPTQIDPVEVLVDGVVVDTFNVSPLTGGTFTVPLGTLTAGQHGIGLVNAAPPGNFPIGLGPGNPILTVTFAAPATVTDPDFQQVTVASGRFQYDPSGSAWAFLGSAGISGNGSAFTSANPPAPQGSHVAFLQSEGSMSQNVVDWAAGSYVITFDAAQRGNYQASRENLSVLIDSSVVDTFTPSGSSYQSYTTAPFTVTAGAAHYHLPRSGQRRGRQHHFPGTDLPGEGHQRRDWRSRI